MVKKIRTFIDNSDQLGMFSSALCLIHCLITPFFVGSVLVSDHHVSAYHYIDYLFLSISFVAVWYSSKRQPNLAIKLTLWAFFGIFTITLLTESMFAYSQYILYASSIGLIITHFVNMRECQRCEVQ